MVLLTTVFFFFACKPGDDPGNDPTDPTDPTPNELVKPVVKSLIVENVTITSVKISAWVIPNEKDTKVYVEFRTTTEASYHSQELVGVLTGKDSLKVSFDVVLTANNDYVAHIRANNKAGDNPIIADVKFSTSIVTDADGNVYHVIKIGNQYWLQENLTTTHYADGVAITNITDNYQWGLTDNSKKDAWCWYENKVTNKIYGALYNTYINKKTLISGYHIPSVTELTTLVSYLGTGNEAAFKLMDNSRKYWNGYTKPNNSSAFTALPGGIRSGSLSDPTFCEFKYIGGYGYFMTTTPTIFLVIGGDETNGENIIFFNSAGKENSGLSVRLIKD
jgi:uncharacterized protein (TIGR02145 family)